MSAFLDAKRFLHLHAVGCVTSEEPVELLKQLVEHFERYGFKDELASRNIRLSRDNAELQVRVDVLSKRAIAHEELKIHHEQENKVLKDQIRNLTRHQTSVTSSLGLNKEPDLDDKNFVPCRDERCREQGLHAVHDVTGGRAPKKKRDSHA